MSGDLSVPTAGRGAVIHDIRYSRFTGDLLDTAVPTLSPETDTPRLLDAIDGETSCVVVQYPDIMGRIGDLSELAERAHANGALLIAVVLAAPGGLSGLLDRFSASGKRAKRGKV